MTAPSRVPVGRPSMGWNYVAGRVAVWERELSPRAFFAALLRTETLPGALAELSRAPGHRSWAATAGGGGATEALAAFFDGRRADLLACCPDHPLKDYAAFPERYRAFRTAYMRFLAEGIVDEAALEKRFRALAPRPAYADGLAAHRALLLRVDGPQTGDVPERSLFLDSAACTMIDLFGQATPQPKAKRFFRDRAALAAWAAVLRARRNRTPDEHLLHWFLFRGGRDFVAAVLAEKGHPARAARPYLDAATADALEAADPARVADDVDAAVADALRGDVLACRAELAGPERALAYFEALAVEETNLRLCLAAVAGGLDRTRTEERLRREYV